MKTMTLAPPRFAGLAIDSVAVAAALAFAYCALFALYPLGVGGDYVNHLARIHIETSIAQSDALARYYEVRPALTPDLYMDALAPLLAPFFGVVGAGAIACAVAVILGPIAGFALSRRLHGAAAGWLPAIGFAGVFSLNFEFGFINFIAASGLSLFAFAAWISVAPGRRRALLFAPVSLLLLGAHALGFLFFGFLVLIWELAGAAWSAPEERKAALRRLFLVDSAAFLPPLVLLALALTQEGGGLRAVDAPTDFIASRGAVLLSMFRYYGDASAVVTALVSFVVLLAGFGLGLRLGALRIDRRMACVCASVFALMMATPEHVAGIWGLHFRFGPALLVLLAASVRFAPQAMRARAIFAPVLGAALFLQFQHGAPKMAAADDFHDELRADFALLPDGARLLQAFEPAMNMRLAHHAGALAVIERDAFVPTLFTNTSPVGVRPEWRARHLPAGLRPDLARLAVAADAPAPVAANGLWSEDYLSDWPSAFTHVLYMRAGDGPAPPLEGAAPLAAQPGYVLYAVTKNQPARP